MALAVKVDPRLLALVWKREQDSWVHLLPVGSRACYSSGARFDRKLLTGIGAGVGWRSPRV